MSAVRKGGVTQKVLTGRTAASLQNYRDRTKGGEESYLFAATQHCSHNAFNQIEEWKAVREENGTQSATRRLKGKYEEVDADTGLHPTGEQGTHVRELSGGRWRKRPVRAGEMPTHLRIEPKSRIPVKESEAVHTIYAAGADMVTPDNPEDLERFWEAVNAERTEHYSGLQESRWLERNGDSGLVHIHVASNATIYQDFESGGVHYRAGQKMAGSLTQVHSIRSRFNTFLRDHPEHGMEQSLADVGTKKYTEAQVRSGQRDYWGRKRAASTEEPIKESNHEKIRRLADESLAADGADDHDGFIEAMKDRGVSVTEVGLRRGKATAKHDYGYKLEGVKQAVRGKTLGADYKYETIGTQLERKAAGQQIQHRDRQSAGPDRPLPLEQKPWTAEDHAEFDALRADVEEIARPQREAAGAETGQELDADEAEQPTVTEQADFDETQAPATTFQSMLEEAQEEVDQRPPQQRPEAAQTEPEAAKVPATDDAVADQVQAPEEVEAESVASEPAEPENTKPEFRSRLRDLKSRNEKRQAQYAASAQLEEDYRGRDPDAEFEHRATEIKILGPKFLESHGDRLDPEFREHIEARAAQAEERRVAFEERQELWGESKELQANKKVVTDAAYDKAVTKNRLGRNFYDNHIEGIEAARAEGDYRSLGHEKDEYVSKEKAREKNTWQAHMDELASQEPVDPEAAERQARPDAAMGKLDRVQSKAASRPQSSAYDQGLG